MEEETEFDTKTEYGSIKTVENASVPYFGTIFNWLWVLILVSKKYGSIETVKNALNSRMKLKLVPQESGLTHNSGLGKILNSQ